MLNLSFGNSVIVATMIVASSVPSSTSATPFGTLLREAVERSLRQSTDDALDAGSRQALRGNKQGAGAALRQSEIDDAAAAFFGSVPPEVRRQALLRAEPDLLFTDPRLATALGLEAVIKQNPELLTMVLPDQKALDVLTPRGVVARYADIAAKEAAKPDPWMSIDISTGMMKFERPIIVGGVEIKNAMINLFVATGYLGAACTLIAPCRDAAIKLGAAKLLEAAAEIEKEDS
ncbi:hypothetical protein BCF46_3792 [Litoreibacter meonggei]|uniref:Uncharacterized protein n=1 Tax=Litoreibacter meonggei TaxID=1049199 RepID=A0A497VBK1_9RHOB|nr:hypothetical protein [Litoreibacter meonggei]RLJ36324.1 hypothetical protein BCF46_3792 [Litoreibacter meonggei]